MEPQISFAQITHAAKKSPALRNRWAGAIALIALALLLLLPGQAEAQTTTLITSGTWSDANNWSNGVPTDSAYAYVDNKLIVSVPVGISGTALELYVGNSGTGTLSINGGTVTDVWGYLGVDKGSNGTATISGSGTWANSKLSVGYTGTGTLNIVSGIVTGSTSYIGFDKTSNGTVNFASGTWNNSEEFDVGVSGTGTLNLRGSGVVSVAAGSGTLTIARDASSVGTLNLGTSGTSAGTLNAAVVTGGKGSATVNFNHFGSYTFAPTLTGNLSVNQLGVGTTVLDGTNTYTGLTTVSRGELDVNGSLSSSGTVSVASGATLGGSGATGSVTLSGGTIGGTLNTASISGSGTIAPGNSPGILTTGTLTGGGGLSFKFELKQSAPVYSSATDSKNDLVHVTGSLNALTSADQITVYLSSAVPGTTYLGGLFVDNLSAALLGAAVNNASFLYYVLDATGTSTTQGDIYYNGSYYTSLSAWYVAVSAVDLANTVFETGTVASGSELKFTVVPEPGTWAMILGGTGVLAFIQRRRKSA